VYWISVPFHDTGSARNSVVEPCVVEAFADVPPVADESLLVTRNRGETFLTSRLSFTPHAALEHDQMAWRNSGAELRSTRDDPPLREENWRTALFERLDDFVEDEPISLSSTASAAYRS